MRNFLLRSAVLAAVALMLGQVADAEELRRTNTRVANRTATTSTAVASSDDGISYSIGDNSSLFGNYYAQPGTGTESAALYQAPHPTPYKTGHVFYTYEPFRPHEFMYRHTRTYYNFYGNSEQFYSDPYGYCRQGYGLNKTTVVWKTGCNHFTSVPGSIWPLQNIRNIVSKAADRICSRAAGCGKADCNVCR